MAQHSGPSSTALVVIVSTAERWLPCHNRARFLSWYLVCNATTMHRFLSSALHETTWLRGAMIISESSQNLAQYLVHRRAHEIETLRMMLCEEGIPWTAFATFYKEVPWDFLSFFPPSLPSLASSVPSFLPRSLRLQSLPPKDTVF